MTDNVVAIFATLLHSGREMYGLEIANMAEIGSATIYAAITRMEGAGYLEARWEEIDPAEAGRPRQRLYRLTADGAEVAKRAVEDYRARTLRRTALWQPGPPSAEAAT